MIFCCYYLLAVTLASDALPLLSSEEFQGRAFRKLKLYETVVNSFWAAAKSRGKFSGVDSLENLVDESQQKLMWRPLRLILIHFVTEILLAFKFWEFSETWNLSAHISVDLRNLSMALQLKWHSRRITRNPIGKRFCCMSTAAIHVLYRYLCWHFADLFESRLPNSN